MSDPRLALAAAVLCGAGALLILVRLVAAALQRRRAVADRLNR